MTELQLAVDTLRTELAERRVVTERILDQSAKCVDLAIRESKAANFWCLVSLAEFLVFTLLLWYAT